MPTPITEFFNGGVVTARHPALLMPGEVQQADHCVYRLHDTSIQRAPGRTIYNSTPLSAGLKGLAQLTFDQKTDQLIAWPQGDGTNSFLYKSDFTAITGVFSIITGPGVVVANTHSNTTVDGAPAGSFTNMIVGTKITGSGIPNGTYVTIVNSGTAITISQAATSTLTGTTLAFDAGIALPFQDLGTETLDIIQWQNSFFVLPKNGNVVRLFWKQFPTGTTAETLIGRPAGLLPITTAPTITVQSGAGWSSVLGNGYYWFLVTEILTSDNPDVPDIEAGYTANEGRAVVVQITTYATQFIRITFPTIKNDGTNGTNRATHWGIYMSFITAGVAAYSDPTNMPSLATFRRIAKMPIADTVRDIKFDNTTQGTKLPTTAGAGPDALAQFSNPSGFFDRGGQIAQGVSGSGVSVESAIAGFGFSAGSPYSGYSITGLKVTIVSSIGFPNNTAGYYLWLDNNGAKSSNRNFGVSDRTTMFAKEWGGQFDTWGQTWTPTDISNIRVIILKGFSAALQVLKVDYIEVTVYYSGAALDTGSINLDGPYYPVVTYRSQVGFTISDTANFTIPPASTGDIFKGSLVLNDTSNPSLIRYSIPNAPESFPKPYFLKFNSKKKDIITFIRKVGQILIVGMRDSIKRVNYLPTELDIEFQQGIAHEDVVTDHGIVGPLAATLFDLSNSGVVLAYASYNGWYFTDGITARPLNLDIKLQDLVKSTALGTSVFRVYPREKWLVFFYCPNGATHTKNTRAIIFHYASDKIKEGGFLPATGPLSISARSAAEAHIAGLPYLLTGHQTDGKVYVEDSGDTQAASYQVHNDSDSLVSAPIVPLIRTRKIFASGYARDTAVQRIYILHHATGTSYTVSSTTTISSTAVTSAAAFTNVVVGMKVRSTGSTILPDTIVTVKTDNSNITISQAVTASGTENLVFDDGTLTLVLRGSAIDENMVDLATGYPSTLTGDLLVKGLDDIKQGLELKIQKVLLPSASTADLGQQMKLNNFTYLADDSLTEINRSTQ